MRYVSLLILLLASSAGATNNGNNDCPGNSCHGGGSGTGGTASAEANGDQTVQIIDESISVDNSMIQYEDTTGDLKDQAQSAAPVQSFSHPDESPCGDSSGLSGQTGVAGGGLATITESCRAYRLQRLQAGAPDDLSTKLATFTHLAGWFPRLLLHVASCGVLN